MRSGPRILTVAGAALLSFHSGGGLQPSRLVPDGPIRGVRCAAVAPVVVDLAAIPTRERDETREGAGEPERAPRASEYIPDGLLRAPVRLESPHRDRRSELLVASSPPLLTTFAAIDGPSPAPPDTNGAVGLSDVATMLNSGFRVQDRTGVERRRVGARDFWGAAAGRSLTDPRLAYDTSAGRWIATMLEGTSNWEGSVWDTLLVASSRTEDPAGSWNIYRLAVVSADFPVLGYSDDRVAVSALIFPERGAPSRKPSSSKKMAFWPEIPFRRP